MPLSKREREVLADYFSGRNKPVPLVMKKTRGGKISGKRLLKHLILPHTIITDRIRERRMREAMEELNRKYPPPPPKRPESNVPVSTPHPSDVDMAEPVFGGMPEYWDLNYVDEDMPQTYQEEERKTPTYRRSRNGRSKYTIRTSNVAY